MSRDDDAAVTARIQLMLDAGVQVEPLHIFEAIWNKVVQVGNGVRHGVVHVRSDYLSDRVKALKLFLGTNQSKTKTVQELIDRAKSGRNLAKLPPQGSAPR